jgi:hypothetical protein
MTRRNDSIVFERTVGQAKSELEPCQAPSIVGYRQCVPQKTAILILSIKTVDGPLLESLYKTLLELQCLDNFIIKKNYKKILLRTKAGSERHWKMCNDGLLCCCGVVYVPPEEAICKEIIEINYDHPLAGHMGQKKTI